MYDGINLRLEIGICSMGPADSRELPPAPGTAPAPPAAAAVRVAADGSNDTAAPEEQPATKKRKVQQQQQPDEGQQGASGQQQWPEKRLEIVAASAVCAGAEVHNTYVSKSWLQQLLPVHMHCGSAQDQRHPAFQAGDSWRSKCLAGPVAAQADAGCEQGRRPTLPQQASLKAGPALQPFTRGLCSR